MILKDCKFYFLYFRLQMIMQQHNHEVDHTNLIEELPEIVVSENSKIPKDKNECMICMSSFELNEKVKIMPCTHFFHTDCIKKWFEANDTCPICKSRVDSNDINAENP